LDKLTRIKCVKPAAGNKESEEGGVLSIAVNILTENIMEEDSAGSAIDTRSICSTRTKRSKMKGKRS